LPENHEQLAELGGVARNICHDLKNFLTAIQGNAELAQRQGDPRMQATAYTAIMQASEAARDLCNQVLAYAEAGKSPRELFDLQVLLRDSLELMQVVVPEGVQLRLEASSEPVPVEGNRSQLRQIIHNLIVNALQAAEAEQGEVAISLQASEGGKEVILEVVDTGPGISLERQEEIFDLGYTTKATSLGHGLGLALVKELAEAHGGGVSLQSEPGKGCCFRVHLPLSSQHLPEPSAEVKPAPTGSRKHNVLLVDDEAFMLSLGMDILQTLGYRVTVAASGMEALELVKNAPAYFDAVLSDSRMPEMNGEELARKLQDIRSDLPFVLVTAFASVTETYAEKRDGVCGVVAKPFLIEDLRDVLSTLLCRTS